MQDIIWNVIEATNVLFEMLIVMVYFNKLFEKKYEKNQAYLQGYLLASVILYFSGILSQSPTVLITVTFLLLIGISVWLYEGNFIKKIFLSLLFIIIIFISEILFIGSMTVFDIGLPSQIVQQGLSRIIGMIGTKIIYFWIVVIVCRLINKKIREVPLKQWIMIFLMPVVSTIILYIIYYSFMNESEKSGMFLYGIAVMGVLYINFAVFDFFETYLKQIRLSVLEQVVELENLNYKQMEYIYNDMRKLKHDVNNQLSVIKELVAQSKTETAKEVLVNISKQLDNAGTICYTGETIIDSVINIKLKKAYEDGIKISKRINVTEFKLDKIELCRVMGNALDNAIEGCRRSECKEPHIYISIQEVDEKIVIEINNDSDYVNIHKMQTKKANKSAHGIGMKSMKDSIKKLNGHMSYDCKDNIFSLKIVILNK